MMNSKIPRRATISKPQVVSDIAKEKRSTNVQQKDKLRNPPTATIKQSNQIAKEKDTKTWKGKADNKNVQNKPTQEKKTQASQHVFKDRSKNTSKKNENVNPISNHILRESNINKFSKAEKLNSLVSNLRNQMKRENHKTENHPSQPDIEFVPDENCRNRILSCRALSPAALKLPFRSQSSYGGRCSIFNQPIPVPVDPFKTLLKALENVDPERRRSSVKKLVSPRLSKFSPHRFNSPMKPFEIANRRLTDIKLKEKTKSAKKVTFKLPDSGLAQQISWQERKLEINKLTDISEKSDPSQHSSPELDKNVKLLSNSSNASSMGRPPFLMSFKDMLNHCNQNSAADMEGTKKPDKIRPGILRSNTLRSVDYDERCKFKLHTSNPMPGKLRRSTSASELNCCPSSKSEILKGTSSQCSGETDHKKSNHIQSSYKSFNVGTFNTLRTSISSPELSVKFCNGKMDNCDSNMQSIKNIGIKHSIFKSNNAAAALIERRESRNPACLLRKHRRSMSASEINYQASDQNVAKGESSKSSSKMESGGSNQVHSSAASCKAANICNSKTLRTSISSPELSDRFFNTEAAKFGTNAPIINKKTSIFRNNTVTGDYDERRKPEIHSNFGSRKLRRSMSTSELNCSSPMVAQTLFTDTSSKVSSTVDSVKLNKISSSSLGACNFRNLRTSISSPDLKEIFSKASEKKLENDKLYSQNKDLHFKLKNLQSNSTIRVAEPSRLYSSQCKNVVQSTCSPKLCTPCPVSFNPKSRLTDTFSPEFLCRRTSNIKFHAPIKTPLAMRHLAEDELEDHRLSPVCQKLDFEAVQQEKDDSKISKVYLQTFKTQQVIMDCLADQECCIFLSCADEFRHVSARGLSNPIAKILESGDEMHFVPVALA